MQETLLDIEGLSVAFDTDEGRLMAVEDVGFAVRRNEVLGLVGESGCGKSVTALSLVSLIPSPPGLRLSGKALFEGQDLFTLSSRDLKKIRGAEISMIFQEPGTALSPLHKIGAQLVETLRLHKDISKKDALDVAALWLKKTGIPSPEAMLNAFPHELSGGMQQRVMIAMALMLDPRLVIADEPTTALDVTISAQIFDLMREMRKERTSVLLITHDLGVVWEMCDRVVVMYAGQIVEEAPKKELFESPAHPYTQGLLASVPVLSRDRKALYAIAGQVPSPLRYPPGCRFHDRCPKAFQPCKDSAPALAPIGPGRKAACFLMDAK